MVNSAERHRELVAHFAAERPWLRRAKMMGIRGLTAANKAGLRGNELTMVLVADASRFADRQHAFVDAATDAAAQESSLPEPMRGSSTSNPEPSAATWTTWVAAAGGFHGGGSQGPAAPLAGLAWPPAARQRPVHRRMPRALPGSLLRQGRRRRPLACSWRAGCGGPSGWLPRRTEGRQVQRATDPASPRTDRWPEPASQTDGSAFCVGPLRARAARRRSVPIRLLPVRLGQLIGAGFGGSPTLPRARLIKIIRTTPCTVASRILRIPLAFAAKLCNSMCTWACHILGDMRPWSSTSTTRLIPSASLPSTTTPFGRQSDHGKRQYQAPAPSLQPPRRNIRTQPPTGPS